MIALKVLRELITCQREAAFYRMKVEQALNRFWMQYYADQAKRYKEEAAVARQEQGVA